MKSCLKYIWLAIFLFSLLCQGQTAKAQEIPNGDNDLLWERSLRVDGKMRDINDVVFHPINGNIIAAVNHEIWEIDPKNGNTIRVFEGETGINEHGHIDISSNGNLIILSNGGATNLKLYDYNSGKLMKDLLMLPWSDVDFFPNTTNILFHQSKNIIIYDAISDKIIKKSNSLPYNKYFQYSRLSADGKFIALSLVTDNFGDQSYSMELWDTETLTKLQDLGELSGNPDDIQFSNNNEYLGFAFTPGFLLFKKSNGQFNRYLVYSPPILPSRFCFTNTNKLFLRVFKDDIQYGATYIINLNNLDSIYKFTAGLRLLRVNSNNELFTIGFDTLIGTKMQFYSNKWYEVGVTNPIEINQATISPNPATDYITLDAENLEPMSEIVIYDVFGKPVLIVETGLRPVSTKIDVSTLPTGTYFLHAGSGVYKFMVVR